jgi:acyl-coenzyme A synthetase/AMP-(fatty) acid ligase
MPSVCKNPAFQEHFETSFTYINGFLRNVTRYANRPALTNPATQQRWTYRQLNADVNRLAHALQKDGVKKGDVVMYQLRNMPEFVFCYLAPQKLGAVNCPINYHQASGEITLNIEDSAPRVFVYDSYFQKEVSKALEMLTMLERRPHRVVCVNTTGLTEAPEGEIFFEDYVSGQPETEPEITESLGIYDETTRLYTSGTTNRPKGVPLYSINEVLSAHDVIMHFPLSPMDRTMNMTPWFHRGGLHSGGPCPTLYVGGEVVALRDFNPNHCLKLANQYDITFLIGVPAVLNMLSRAQDKLKLSLPSLKGIITMGSPLDKASCIHFQETLTPNIFNGYGTTETFWNTFLRPYDLPDRAGSAGHACTDDDVRVVRCYPDRKADPNDVVAQDGTEVGEIIISSPAKASNIYYNNQPMTDQKFYKGFLYTGDLGTWDEDCFVTISGRKDDMIVSSGENIYPAQIEAVLNQHPGVLESCVVGVPDPLREQVVAAYVVPANDDLTVRDLLNYVNDHPMLAPYKRPKFYCISKELPHTATGKLQHFAVRANAAEDLKNGKLKRR